MVMEIYKALLTARFEVDKLVEERDIARTSRDVAVTRAERAEAELRQVRRELAIYKAAAGLEQFKGGE